MAGVRDPGPAAGSVSSCLRITDLGYRLTLDRLEGTPREIRLGRRDLARMLVLNCPAGDVSHSTVWDLPSWFEPGDVVVLNNSKRIPGVLKGRTSIGGQVELRFVSVDLDGIGGICNVFPKHDVGVGDLIHLDGESPAVVHIEALGLTAHNLARVSAPETAGGLRRLLVDRGRPIPGFFYENHWTCDHLNPFYATEEGSVESPLAGLHFTPDLVHRLEARGVEVRFVTLHSVGSWLPFLELAVEDHKMWSEAFRVPEVTADAVNAARARGSRVVAVGSTSLRALESASEGGRVQPVEGSTDLYITPGYAFQVVTGYFTNFHQFQTSLIVLDAAFAGADLVRSSYASAVAGGYSFFEFGDAVLMWS